MGGDLLQLFAGGVPLFSLPIFFLLSLFLFRFLSAKGKEEKKVMSHFMILPALHHCSQVNHLPPSFPLPYPQQARFFLVFFLRTQMHA